MFSYGVRMKPVWNGAKDNDIINSATSDFSGHQTSLGSSGLLSISHFFHGKLKHNLSLTLCVKSTSLFGVWMCMNGCLCVCGGVYQGQSVQVMVWGYACLSLCWYLWVVWLQYQATGIFPPHSPLVCDPHHTRCTVDCSAVWCQVCLILITLIPGMSFNHFNLSVGTMKSNTSGIHIIYYNTPY